MKRILVPIDFSAVSRSAAKFAIELAEESGSEVLLLYSSHIDYYNEFTYTTTLNMQPAIDEVEKSVKERMGNFQRGLSTHSKLRVEVSGLHLIEAIKETVAHEQVGLIVMGTHGSTGLSELFVGSNTERIVRLIGCPVISVPSAVSFRDIKKILVPVDLREIQDEFLKKLVVLQQLFSASLEFMWVQTPHNIENEESLKKEFQALINTYGFDKTTFSIERNVFPDQGILEHANSNGANMIAMATHSRKGISHLLSGSLAENTVNHIGVPVWTFKLDKKAKNIELANFEKLY
ncbi:MAG: universal stress protein [Cyclobacteriaceae bacterium]